MMEIGAKRDCFAYDSYTHGCRALRKMYCKEEICKYYKTKEERCVECRETRIVLSCDECRKMGIK